MIATCNIKSFYNFPVIQLPLLGFEIKITVAIIKGISCNWMPLKLMLMIT